MAGEGHANSRRLSPEGCRAPALGDACQRDRNLYKEVNDLVAAYASSKYSVFLGIGNGSFNQLNPVSVSPGIKNFVSVAIGDLNGDGHLDLAVTYNPVRDPNQSCVSRHWRPEPGRPNGPRRRQS